MDRKQLNEILKLTAKTPMICLECNHKFKRKIGPKTYEVRCPKCRGFDTMPD